MKKRILYFLSTFNPYGSQIRASRFATCIASAFDVQAVCFWQCGALQPVFERITGRKAVNLEARSIRDLGALRRLRAVLSEFDPHIVHSFMPEMGCFSAAAFRGKKVFSVGNPVRYEPFMQKCWHTLSMNLSDAVIFNSRSTKELSSRYLLSKKREGMIYFPIESHAVSGPVNSERERLGIGSADKVLLSVSRISCRQKGHDILLRAFARVQRTVPATVLVLVGGADSPEDMACLRNIAREESIPENRVIFTGEATDTAPYFRTADVYVVSSRWEGFCNSLAEAMSYGLPAVSTRIGGIDEMIMDRETGLLANPEDPLSLADRILELLNDPSLMQTLSRNGKEHIFRTFGSERVTRDLLEFYTGVLEDGK